MTAIQVPPLSESLQALIFDPVFSELERAFGAFCPFEAAGIESAEIRHGAFIATMLNPVARHGYQARLLRAFLIQAISDSISKGKVSPLAPLDIHLLELEEAEIYPEYRNIDLVIKFPASKIVIAIELKIDASQGKEQLARYRKFIEAEWPKPQWRHILVFLTKNNEVAADRNWMSVGLTSLEKSWRNEPDAPGVDPTARVMLSAYLRMLRTHHMDDPHLNELAARLWAKHPNALKFLVDNRPDTVGSLFQELIKTPDALAARLAKACKKRVTVDRSSTTFIHLGINEWDALPGFKGEPTDWAPSGRLVLIQLIKKPGEIRASIVLGPGEASHRERIFKMAKDANIGVPGKTTYEKWNTMRSKVLVRLSEDKDVNFDDLSKSLATDFEQFFCDVVREFSRPFLNQQSI